MTSARTIGRRQRRLSRALAFGCGCFVLASCAGDKKDEEALSGADAGVGADAAADGSERARGTGGLRDAAGRGEAGGFDSGTTSSGGSGGTPPQAGRDHGVGDTGTGNSDDAAADASASGHGGPDSGGSGSGGSAGTPAKAGTGGNGHPNDGPAAAKIYSGGSGVVAISSGGSAYTSATICALKEDGRIVCWGNDRYGQAIAPAGSYTQVSVGMNHACALTQSGGITCWGRDDDGESTPPAGSFTQVSAGWNCTCALAADGTIDCWGSNLLGQANPPLGRYTSVDAHNSTRACALGIGGTIVCWGGNQAGHGGGDGLPVILPPGPYTQVSSQRSVTCAIRPDGSIGCWFDLDDNQDRQAEWRAPPPGSYTQLSTPCAVDEDGNIVCWGDGELGKMPPPTGSYRQIDVLEEASAACAVKTDGSVTCWAPGANSYGLHRGALAVPSGPYTQVAGGNNPCFLREDGVFDCLFAAASDDVDFAPVGSFTCAPKSDKCIACWDNASGDFLTEKISDFVNVSVPYDSYTQVSCSRDVACAVYADGSIGCWGDDDSGQATAPDGTFTQVSVGRCHACAVRSDGIVTCWGCNEYGQASAPLGSFTQVAAAGYYNGSYTCALGETGGIACWGGDAASRQVYGPAGSYTQISAYEFGNCAIRVDGSMVCWGVAQDPLVFPGPFAQVSSGMSENNASYTCVIEDRTGALFCGTPSGRFVLPAKL